MTSPIYWGTYQSDYRRNEQFIEKMDCKTCNVEVFGQHNTKLVKKLLQLAMAYPKLIIKHFKDRNCPYYITGYPAGIIDTAVLRLLTRKPIVINPLISMYDTLVCDRKLLKERSPIARLLLSFERWALSLADCVITDTRWHNEYFRDILKVPEHKLGVVHIDCDDKVFYPQDKKKTKDKPAILWAGKFSPLHGVKHMLKVAKDTPEAFFRFIGNGQLYSECQEYVKKHDIKNVQLGGYYTLTELCNHINNADAIIVGPYGDCDKARRVFPNKLMWAMACAKQVYVNKTIAKELTGNENHTLLTGDEAYALYDKLFKDQDPKRIVETILFKNIEVDNHEKHNSEHTGKQP